MAKKIVTYPKGIVEDVLVAIKSFIFAVDFVILETEEDLEVPIFLGRPFLNTDHALVDVSESKLIFWVGSKEIIFGVEESTDVKKGNT